MSNGKLDARLAKLQSQLATEHDRFINAARVAVQATLAEFGISLDDLTAVKVTRKLAKATQSEPAKPAKPSKVAGKKKRKAPFKGPQPARYRDPETGKTWSGFGHAPAWITEAKDRAKFLIDGAAS